MWLVDIAQLRGQPDRIHDSAIGEPFGSFNQAITFDNPFGTHADVLAEEALERPLTQTHAMCQIVDSEQRSVSD